VASVYSYKDSNIRRTWALFAGFFVVVIAIGFVFAQVYQNSAILVFAVLFSVVMSFVSYWSSDRIALTLAHAQQIKREDNPYLWNMVENLSITAGLPVPRVYITPETQINAFATGRDPKHAAIAVTQGALTRLENEELEGVLAHELSHVGNRDILISSVAVVLAGVISLLGDMFLRSMFWGGMGRRDSRDEGGAVFMVIALVLSILAPLGAMLIQLAISRRRESLADASGVLLTRYPEGLIHALEKIAADGAPMRTAKTSTAHLWIADPFKGSGVAWWRKLFMTHPPIQDRIKALEGR